MGGYFAPRAVAYEKRITAVIANSLIPELRPVLMLMANLDPDLPYGKDFEDKADLSNPLTNAFATTFKDRCGMAGQSLAAFCDNLGTYSLAGLEGLITCPFLSLAGGGEGPRMVDAGHVFYEKLTGPKSEHIFRSEDGGDAHCQMNNPSLKHQIEFDWLDDVFAKKSNTTSRSKS
jgi:hypothetical protein